MNFTKLLKVFLLVMPLLFFSDAMAVGLQEEAIEGEPNTFFLGQDLNGAIRNKVCDTCPEVRLVITPEAEAYIDRQRVDLKAMADSSKKPYLIFYNVKNNRVTRMYWRSK